LERSRKVWLSKRLWSQVKASVPIACVDVIVSDSRGAILLGWRGIRPYVNVWALPGGRIHLREDISTAARRNLAALGIHAEDFFLVGVFPINFPSRSDISICIAARHFSGNAKPDGKEFKRIGWFKSLPRETGQNYRKMIARWRKIRRMPQLMKFNRF
jgi:ADP-ribose pyrophosphatase YjhB (NUDIX family)